MGTSGAWGGSGGRDWGAVSRQAGELADDPSSANAEAVLEPLADAMEWLEAPEEPQETEVGEPGLVLPPLPVGTAWPALTRTGGGGGPGRLGQGGTPSGAGRRTSAAGGGRSSGRAATVGGRVLSAGLAYQRGDADALTGLGLDLGALQSMSMMRRANTILNRLVGADGDIEAMELRAVNSRVLREMLVNELSGPDAVRLYILEYVMQVYSSETGETTRNGARDGRAAAEAERQLRSALSVRVRQIDLPQGMVGGDRLRDAIQNALGLMRRLMRPR